MEVYERANFISETPQSEEEMDVRKGPWTEEEDSMLKSYVSIHGEGRWNSVARLSGLKRTGKSCRLRWLNYLRPEVRRGNISLEEQLLILQLHSRWGNRWAKISQHLPGRTDNEIKNYWRTRVQKQAKQLKCDVNSKQFRDAMRYVWIPRLIERIRASSSSSETKSPSGQPSTAATTTAIVDSFCSNVITTSQVTYGNSSTTGSVKVYPSLLLPELSADTSSDNSLETQVSSVSDLTTECYNRRPSANNLQNGSNSFPEKLGWIRDDDGNMGIEAILEEQTNIDWFGGGDHSMPMEISVWNDEDIRFLQQQLHDD